MRSEIFWMRPALPRGGPCREARGEGRGARGERREERGEGREASLAERREGVRAGEREVEPCGREGVKGKAESGAWPRFH